MGGSLRCCRRSAAPATGPRLPEVKVPTASAGVITLPAAVLPAPGAVDLKSINPKGDLIWTNMGGSGKGGAAAMAGSGGDFGLGGDDNATSAARPAEAEQPWVSSCVFFLFYFFVFPPFFALLAFPSAFVSPVSLLLCL